MVSKNISDACYPIKIKMGKDMKESTLVLNVTHGKEMEVEYEKNKIIDKINSFFGYNCIKKISLKIVEEKIVEESKILPKIKDFKKIDERIKSVKDSQLKSSLISFLKAYNDKNK